MDTREIWGRGQQRVVVKSAHHYVTIPGIKHLLDYMACVGSLKFSEPPL